MSNESTYCEGYVPEDAPLTEENLLKYVRPCGKAAFISRGIDELLRLRAENSTLRADRDAAVAEAVRAERARATLLCEKKAARYRQREAEVFSECDTDATVAMVCEALADSIRRGE